MRIWTSLIFVVLCLVEITHAQRVRPHEFPWTVRLISSFDGERDLNCGAVLIAENFVLTALECVTSPVTNDPPNRIVALFGRHDLRLDSEEGQQSRAMTEADIIVHPQHNEYSFAYALIKLSSPVDINEYVKPAILPNPDQCQEDLTLFQSSTIDECQRVFAVGWGNTGSNVQNFNTMRRSNLDIRQFMDCGIEQFSETRICAGRKADACIGDVGAPLMCTTNGRDPSFLLGIVRHIDGCGPPDAPSIHTRVCPALAWLNMIVGPRKLVTFDPDGDVVTCQTSVRIPNGVVSAGGNDVGDVRSIACNPGFVRKGDDTIVCQPNGQWEITVSCDPLRLISARGCGIPSFVENGRISEGSSDVGAFRTISCDGDFQLVGDDVIFCQDDGYWTKGGLCEPKLPINCSDEFPNVENGQIQRVRVEILNEDAQISGTRLPVICQNGYELNGPAFVRCESNGQWSQPGTCNPKDCGPLPFLNFGTYANGNTIYGSRRAVLCDDGYKLRAGTDGEIECQGDGAWSQPGRCVPVDCGQPPDIENGRISNGPTTFPASRNVRCNPGFELAPGAISQILCLGNGSWTDPGRCQPERPRNCGNIPVIGNGTFSMGSSEIGSKRTLLCDNGYNPSGITFIECLRDGTWSSVGRCDPVSCGPVPTVANGAFLPGPFSYRSVRTLECSPGYKIAIGTSDEITCHSDGTWSPPGFCTISGCGHPPSVPYGSFRTGGTTTGSTRVLECRQGYRLASNSPTRIECRTNGVWSTPGSCEPIRCGELPEIENGMFRPGPSTYSSTRRFDCVLGYRLDGQGEIQCQSDGTWSTPGQCVLGPGCGQVPSVTNGQFRNGRSNVGASRTLQCQPGFAVSGSRQIVCGTDRQWSEPGRCERSGCGSLPVVANGAFTDGSSEIGSQRELICNNGFGITSNSNEIQCLQSGDWSQPGTCEPVGCGSLPNVAYGLFRPGSTSFRSVRELDCFSGYQIKRGTSNQIECNLFGRWSLPGTCEPVSCGPIPVPQYGKFSPGSSTYGSVRSLECDYGFNLKRGTPPTSVCQETGIWSQIGTCEAILCPTMLPMIANGELSGAGFSVGQRRRINCDQGYSLSEPTKEFITCQENGRWTDPEAFCTSEVVCDMAQIVNGNVGPGSNEIGSRRYVQCNNQYQLPPGTRRRYIECRPNGQWFGPMRCIHVLPVRTVAASPTKPR